jgi:[acyl-carrier-protein] S-malonyltransferase
VVAVRERGRLMQQAVPAGEGTMAVLMGIELAAVERLCEEARAGEVLSPANLNGAGQIAVAGHTGAVERLLALAAARRIRAQRLPVSAPFHCALMAPAATGLARHLEDVRFVTPRVPVWTSVEARPVAGAAELPGLLVRQVTSPVRWEETVRGMAGLGATVALETGPGRVLTGLLKRTVATLPGVPAGDLDGVARAREMLS